LAGCASRATLAVVRVRVPVVFAAVVPAIAIAIVACSRHAVGPQGSTNEAVAETGPPPPVLDSAVAAVDAGVDAASLAIGPAGGIFRGEGTQLVIPPDALKEDRVFKVTRVTGAALADWPRGTEVGYAFEPANERFRIPITIKLPHPEGEGQVVCQSRPGERLEFEFEAMHDHRFPVHVNELPQRCAVYSPEHVKALKAVRDREGTQVSKTNKSFRWESKGKVCDPHELVRPNAGKDLREPPGLGGCPPGMAAVKSKPGLCVDRWEAHVVELLEDDTEHTWSSFFNPGQLRVRAKSAPNAVPQAYISQVQAVTACANAGKRLCKDDEWVAACRSVNNTRFPYGADEKRGTCNDHRDQHPAMQYLESHDLSVFTKLEHPCINQLADSLLPGGAKKECVTPEGVFDIVGNLHEWTADPSGHFRGGYYVDTWLNGHGCDYVTTAHEARYWDYSTGFRCCASIP
jgi:sulfatase modifying factor 1